MDFNVFNNLNNFNNGNTEEEWLIILIGIGFFILIVTCIIFLVISKRKRKTKTPSQNYETMTPAELALAQQQAANDFYNWNQSQFVALTGGNAPGSLTSDIPLNVPHMIAMIAAGIALDPGMIGKELKLLKKVAMRIGKLVPSRAATLCAKILARSGEKLLVRLGVRAAAKALTAAAVKFSTALTTKLETAASTGPAAPYVLLAEFVFSATLGLLDQFGVGGYTELVPSSVYEGMRDEFDRAFRANTVKEGYEWPVIAGPLDKLSQAEYEQKISDGYDVIWNDTSHPATILFINLYQDKKRQVGRDLTDPEMEALLETQGLGKALEKAVMIWISQQVGGKAVETPTGNVYCSYSTSAAAESSFHWPLTSDYENDIYCEWDENDQVAYVRQSAMRTFAEQLGNGCTYNKQTRIPNITEAFCRSNGLDYANGQCKYAEGQEIAEMIFGKTFVRGLIQVFDPKQYESCSDKQMCQGSDTCIDDGYFCRINRLAYMREVKGNARCKPGYEESSPGFCKKECPTDNNGKWNMYGGVCYHPNVRTSQSDTLELLIPPTYGDCPTGDGWRTEPVTCFQDLVCHTGQWTDHCVYWDWGLLGGYWTGCHKTTCNDGPKSISRPRTCPAGYNEDAGMCYAVSRPFDAEVYSTIDPEYGTCPSGQDHEGLFCYDQCPTNWTKVQGGLWCTPNDGFKVHIEAKKRKIPFSTPDFAGSPVGQRIAQITEAGNSGDVGRLGAGLGTLFLATNPIVNGLGLQDFANMIPDTATGEGVQQQ